MIWEFHYHENHNYLEVVVTGPLSDSDLTKMAIERWAELHKYNCNKVLFDFTRITSMLNTVEIYHRPEETEKAGILRVNRTAAVVPDIFWKDFKFMETVYRNRGYDLNVFNDKESAIEYLTNL